MNKLRRFTGISFLFKKPGFLRAKSKYPKMVELLKYISSVAWEHISLYGYYMFEGALFDAINMEGLAEGVNLLKV